MGRAIIPRRLYFVLDNNSDLGKEGGSFFFIQGCVIPQISERGRTVSAVPQIAETQGPEPQKKLPVNAESLQWLHADCGFS